MAICDYCQPDLDGFVRLLPREGKGQAYIVESVVSRTRIEISLPHRQKFEIPIEYCPMCGRKLRRADNATD